MALSAARRGSPDSPRSSGATCAAGHRPSSAPCTGPRGVSDDWALARRHRNDRRRHAGAVSDWIAGAGDRHLGRVQAVRQARRTGVSPGRARAAADLRGGATGPRPVVPIVRSALCDGETDMAPFRIAILWRGDREARRTASAQNNRYHRIFEELSGLGIHAEPTVYDEEFADEVCEQLLKVDGVLVWVDPLSRGKTRALLDPMLRDVASRGPWISAHPDVILKMGTKEVLYRTKHLGWGTDTHLYRTATEFDAMFPSRL